MQLMLDDDNGIRAAAELIEAGKVIAYPTEAVYGLGCDPLNRDAVINILALKSRIMRKGLILIAHSFEQLKPYLALDELSPDMINTALMTWPGGYTWVFPASNLVPGWIRGDFSTVAVRVTKHPVAAKLCEIFGRPIVSTSANISGCLPAKDHLQLQEQFPEGLDAILAGETDTTKSPSEIRDVKTGKILRFG